MIKLVTAILILFMTNLNANASERHVVTIYATYGQLGSGQGTGFFIGRDGLIVTAFHVIYGATQLTIIDSNNSRYDTRDDNIHVLNLIPENDLAIIQVDGENEDYIRIDNSQNIEFQPVRVIGTPRGLPNQRLNGDITSGGYIDSLQLNDIHGKPYFRRSIDVLPIDITIYNGLSGAPILDDSGVLLGVLSGSHAEGGGIAWAIPAKYVAEGLGDLQEAKPLEDVRHWPEFSLMGAGWQSIQRRYSVVYSADHIGKLQDLENLMGLVDGKWRGEFSFVEELQINTRMYGVECWRHNWRELSIDIGSLDRDLAIITGTYSYRTRVQAEVTVDDSWGTNSARRRISESHAEQCASVAFRRAVHGLKDVPQGDVELEFTLSGDLSIVNGLGENGRFSLSTLVKDCEGKLCTGEIYLSEELLGFKFIHYEKIVQGLIVLERAQD